MDTNEQTYKCDDCGTEIKETQLVGRKDEDGFYILYCTCGSKNLKNTQRK